VPKNRSGKPVQATVLVVDDDPVIVDLITNLLEDEYEVVTALDGEDALRILDQRAVDLVLLDLMMPRIDGFAVARHLRATYPQRDIPVLVLSAHHGLQTQAQRLDISGFIIKPFEPEALLSKVAELV
jgi:CheY-like chemotaxis protein